MLIIAFSSQRNMVLHNNMYCLVKIFENVYIFATFYF